MVGTGRSPQEPASVALYSRRRLISGGTVAAWRGGSASVREVADGERRLRPTGQSPRPWAPRSSRAARRRGEKFSPPPLRAPRGPRRADRPARALALRFLAGRPCTGGAPRRHCCNATVSARAGFAILASSSSRVSARATDPRTRRYAMRLRDEVIRAHAFPVGKRRGRPAHEFRRRNADKMHATPLQVQVSFTKRPGG